MIVCRRTKIFFRYYFGEKKSFSGFTIIEMLVTIGVLAIIIVSISAFLSDYGRSSDILNVQLTLQGEARNAADQMVNDLRKINYASNGAYAIDSATATSIVFYSNLNNDSYFEKVRYFINGNNLQKGVIVPTGNPLVYNPASETVTTLSAHEANGGTELFQYYDSAYNGVTGSPLAGPVDVTKITLVKINLILANNTVPESNPFIIETKVNLRNLRK